MGYRWHDCGHSGQSFLNQSEELYLCLQCSHLGYTMRPPLLLTARLMQEYIPSISILQKDLKNTDNIRAALHTVLCWDQKHFIYWADSVSCGECSNHASSIQEFELVSFCLYIYRSRNVPWQTLNDKCIIRIFSSTATKICRNEINTCWIINRWIVPQRLLNCDEF